jgi:glycerol-3-phosphate acyltransferase PlsY
MNLLWSALAVVAGYLIGSLSFAVIVSRRMGLADPRTYGSRNPGATNVLRSGNKAAAVLTLVFDLLKGLLPVLAAAYYAPRLGWSESVPSLVGLAAFVGHLAPLYFRFQGGKGVATAAGVLVGLNPWLGAATLASWAIILFFFRYVSLASIVAAVFAPFYLLLIWGPVPGTLAVVVMGMLLVWRHFPNIQRLIAGTESRLGRKAPDAPAQAAHPHSSHSHSHHKKGHS